MRGARFLAARPRLWKYILAPAMLALAILVGVIWFVASRAERAITWIVSWLPDFLERWVGGALEIVLVAALAVGGYFVFLALAALVAAPFNEMLSEAVEEEVTGAAGSPFSIATFLRDLALGIAHAARRVIAYLFTIALLFVLGVIVPVVGPIAATVLAAVVSARFAAYDAFDAVWARRGWAYAVKIEYLRRHRARSYGLGGAVAALALVPGLNLIALSIGATAATLSFVDSSRQDADHQVTPTVAPAR